MSSTKRLLDLYIYRKQENQVLFLILKRSKKKIYSGQWRMIGGKVGGDETFWQAALREMNEETGLKPKLFWTVPTINHFYEHASDQIHLIPAFASEVTDYKSMVLDDEHMEFKWVRAGQLSSYINWPEQLRILNCIHNILTKDKILPDWIIDIDHT
jgi:dihydroneopterin triphosphate diphosphatase